jgi:hypothetical protein
VFRSVSIGDQPGDHRRDRRVEPGPGDEHDDGRARPDRFRDVEDPHELTLLQADDVEHELGEPILVELEEEIAWQALEHVADRPGTVRLGSALGQCEHGAGPIGDTRDGEHALPVGRRREQSDEAVDRPVEIAHAHTGLTCETVDRGHRLGARDGDPRAVGGRGGRRRGVGGVGAEGVPTELTAGAHLERAVVVPPERCRTEEHHVAVREPPQERVELGQLPEPLRHRVEVGDDAVHLPDRRLDLTDQLAARPLETTLELDLGPGLGPLIAGGIGDRTGTDRGHRARRVTTHRQHRMHEQSDALPVPVEHHPDGVHQERRVVGDDQQRTPRPRGPISG